mmetsp:Transcript_17228/g.28176  ORF Transcript_17228/g.28176 Transcript_17228/m.28176 type:complete len:276 (+) Transcript_17228:495-1322(+)
MSARCSCLIIVIVMRMMIRMMGLIGSIVSMIVMHRTARWLVSVLIVIHMSRTTVKRSNVALRRRGMWGVSSLSFRTMVTMVTRLKSIMMSMEMPLRTTLELHAVKRVMEYTLPSTRMTLVPSRLILLSTRSSLELTYPTQPKARTVSSPPTVCHALSRRIPTVRLRQKPTVNTTRRKSKSPMPVLKCMSPLASARSTFKLRPSTLRRVPKLAPTLLVSRSPGRMVFLTREWPRDPRLLPPLLSSLELALLALLDLCTLCTRRLRKPRRLLSWIKY